MAKISVTRALAQIKSLDDRIQKATAAQFVTYAVGGKSVTGMSVQEAERVLKANLQSVVDMINQRAALKGEVVRSNAITIVVIGGVTMTVAQAIERKSSIKQELGLLHALRTQLGAVNQKIEQVNTQVAQRLDVLIQTAVGKDRKVDEAEVSGIVTPFKEQNQAKIIDPNGLDNAIHNLQARTSDFLMEVDYALSEVNAVTQIEVV